MPLSATARRALYRRETSQVLIGLIRINHPSFVGGPMRYANSRTNVTSRGNVYEATAFEAQVPPQVEGREPTVTVTISNVDRLIEAALAALVTEPKFVYEMVLASDLDNVVVGPYELPLRSSETGLGQIRLTLGGGSPILSKKFPSSIFDQSNFAGLEAV